MAYSFQIPYKTKHLNPAVRRAENAKTIMDLDGEFQANIQDVIIITVGGKPIVLSLSEMMSTTKPLLS
jgi:hypothetical protein